MITFKEYRELTKTTTQHCLKISGIIFSVCFCIVYMITETLPAPILRFVLMILVCIILGNLFGVYIWLLAITTSFKKVKRVSKLMEELPKDIVNQYKLSLVLRTNEERNNYPTGKIIGNTDDYTILLDCDKFHVFLKLLNYSGDCFVERIKRKKWHSMTSTDFVEWIECVTNRHNS